MYVKVAGVHIRICERKGNLGLHNVSILMVMARSVRVWEILVGIIRYNIFFILVYLN